MRDYLAIEDKASHATGEAIRALTQLGYKHPIDREKLEKIVEKALYDDGSICLSNNGITVWLEGYIAIYGDEYICMISVFKNRSYGPFYGRWQKPRNLLHTLRRLFSWRLLFFGVDDDIDKLRAKGLEEVSDTESEDEGENNG